MLVTGTSSTSGKRRKDERIRGDGKRKREKERKGQDREAFVIVTTQH